MRRRRISTVSDSQAKQSELAQAITANIMLYEDLARKYQELTRVQLGVQKRLMDLIVQQVDALQALEGKPLQGETGPGNEHIG